MAKKYFTDDSLQTLIGIIKEQLDGKATSNHSHSAQSLSGVLPISKGGTGRTDATPVVYSETYPGSSAESGVIYVIPI